MDKITQVTNLSQTKGDSPIYDFYIRNNEGSYLQLDTTDQIYMTVRNLQTDEKVFQLNYKDGDKTAVDGYSVGGIWHDTDSGDNPVYKLIIRADKTAGMNYYDRYQYDIQVNISEMVFTLFSGRFELTREATLPTDEGYEADASLKHVLRPYLTDSTLITATESTAGAIAFDTIRGNTTSSVAEPTPTNISTLASVGDSGSLSLR